MPEPARTWEIHLHNPRLAQHSAGQPLNAILTGPRVMTHERSVKVVEASALEGAREALRAIRGPEDQGRWIEVYRAAGGGYEGLQAIAREALRDG